MRVPEPQNLMTDINQCRSYNKYASNSNNLKEYVNFYKEFIGIEKGTVVDLGSGSCNFVIALAIAFPKLQFTCYEDSDAMIQIAKENIDRENLSNRINLIKDDISNASGIYDVVLANRLLHHINETENFWELVSSLGENILVIDINRPPKHVIDHIKEFDEYPEPFYKEDLINSMQAAYSLDEVTEQIQKYSYKITSDKFHRLFVYQTR
jgi:2-polyprenyl-3-methyl-5-hydroxy-6-metoxy-1,4-benzoquinol methylase